ncbi:MAG: bifunctional metallophosphatase/5'-nucleotidase [Propionibacteriales bacterium]|nr:bifunctional metallophosphatase/5'-nucleotidase [Propionibacteriales bacterium]
MTALPSGRLVRRAAALAAAVALCSLSIGSMEGANADKRKPAKQLELQVLSINDFHGNLEPIPATSSSGRVNQTPAGGVEFLSTHLDLLRDQAEDRGAESVTVAAGDLIGASPLLSAAFHDEPTIEAMNQVGLEVASVGNHEFDEGWRELVRMQRGGCLPDGDGADNQNSCPDPEQPFRGADFQYLAANVFHEDSGRNVLPAVEIKKYGKTEVAFIGMTLEDTPNIVTKAGVEGLEFTDEVETANALVVQLKDEGIKTIVMLIHEGGFPADPTAYNACPGISGPIVDINAGLSAEIDAVITGHTHQGYNCALPDPEGNERLVTSAFSFGRLVTEVDLTIDTKTGDAQRDLTTANNTIVTRDVAKDGVLTALIAKHKELVAPIANEVIGHLSTSSVTRTPDDSAESALGNLIADAQKADASLLEGGAAPEIAFMNPGGIRADLLANAAGEVTYEAAFTTQPFNNYDVAMDLTGAQVLALLEQQWSGPNAASPKVLQVSGIEYTWDQSNAAGAKVVQGTVLVNGEPLDPARTYRVTANSFLSDGGDGFSVFADATNKYFGGLDIDALAAFLQANDPYTPVPQDRIDVQP